MRLAGTAMIKFYYPAIGNGDSIGESLLDLIHDFGVPEHHTFDGATAQEVKNTKFYEDYSQTSNETQNIGSSKTE